MESRCMSKLVTVLEQVREITRENSATIKSLHINYKEMGEFPGDCIVPIVTIEYEAKTT